MARTNAYTACPIFSNPEGGQLQNTILLGVFGDGTGMALNDTHPEGIAVFAELPSADAVLTAGTIVKGIWSRVLIKKAQTADVGIAGVEAQCRVKAAYISGGSGLWAVWEQSGTVNLSTGNANGQAIEATVDSEAGLTATNLCAIRITTSVHASATMSNSDFSAIRVSGGFAGSAKLPFDYILDVKNEGAGTPGPAVAFARFTAVSNVIATTGTLTVSAGSIKVYIGTNARYIQLYSS